MAAPVLVPATATTNPNMQHSSHGGPPFAHNTPTPPHPRPHPPLQVLGGEGIAPDMCTPAVLEHIVQQHMDSPSLLAIFPLQDLLPLSSRLPDCSPEEQQVNEPSNPLHYWRYRLHVTLEEVAADADLRALLVDMLQAAQRYHGALSGTG